MADNMKLVTKEYVDAIETDIKDSSVGQKTPNGGEIFSIYEGDTANKALSEATAAFGSSTKAGGKGFKIIATAKLTDNTGTYTLNSVEGIEVGMEYSVKLTYSRVKCGKILSISGTTITVDGYPNIALSTKQDTTYDKQNYLTIVKRPDLGDIDIGFFAATFGENCIAQDRSGFVAGRDNTVLGQYGAAFGRNNITDYCGFVSGRNNMVLGNNSTIFSGTGSTIVGNDSTILGSSNSISGKGNNTILGSSNSISGKGNNTILGSSNSISGKEISYSILLGHTNKIEDTARDCIEIGIGLVNNPTSFPHIILGQYNEIKNTNNNILTVGAGDALGRKNIIEVTKKDVLINGYCYVAEQGLSDTSILQKQYVDNNFIGKKVIQDDVKRAYVSLNDRTLYIGVEDTVTPQSIALRTPAGTLRAADPITDNDLSTKQYADTKVPQVTSTSTYDRVYTTSKSGVQGTLAYSTSATANTIAARGVGGTLDVGEPTKDTNATTKLYVDTQIATQVSSVYKAKGSITDISALPTPDKAHEGFVYNIENEFTTTDQFVEGAGKTYPAGTNVVIVNTIGTEYKYDVLAGMVDLSNYVTNDTLTTGLRGKLDKVTSTSTNPRLYTIDIAGGQGTVSYAQSATANTIVQRDANGRIKIAEPETDNEAATKKYVDDAIGNITALFASLVDMTKTTTQSDEPADDTEIINDPTDNEEETVNA